MLFDKIKLQKVDIYSFLVVIIVFISDRLSKAYVIKLIEINEREIFVNNFLNITLNWNRGIGFGLLSYDATLIYHIISALILLIIIYWFITNKENFSKISMLAWCCLIGGGISNFIDRLFNGHVTDFIILHYNNYFFPGIFNIADIFITFAVLLLIIELGFNYEQKS